MQNKHRSLKPISGAMLLVAATLSQHAYAELPAKAVLDFTTGVGSCDLGGTFPDCTYGLTNVAEGSYFAMDLTVIGTFENRERTRIETAGTGITLEKPQVAGAIDLDWSFAGSLGRHITKNTLSLTSDTINTYSIDMAGFVVNWNGGDIDMGADTATLTCGIDCSVNDTFILRYETIVPSGDFKGINYQFYLEGTISQDNTAPISANTSISTTPATEYTWTPQATDPDGDTLTCSIGTQPSNGLASVLSDCSSGLFTPTDGASFTGADSFTYVANDGITDSSESTVSVTIAASPPPSCENIVGSTIIGGSSGTITIDVTDNSVCTIAAGGTIDPDTLAVSSTSTNGGTVSVDTTTGIVTYTPPSPSFAGADTFTYTVDDTNGSTSSPATIAVNVITSSAGSPPSTPDGTLFCGATATAVNCKVTQADIGVPDEGFGKEQALSKSCIGGCFDFIISSVIAGGEARIVLPLSTAIPAATLGNAGHKIIYRKLMTTGWKNFDTSGNNRQASAPGTVSGTDVSCPTADSALYINNLNAGDRCVRLTITDGGPNDADGIVNGTVVDPGGVAETYFTSGSDGCSMSATPVNARERADWLLVAAFISIMAGMSFYRRRSTKQGK